MPKVKSFRQPPNLPQLEEEVQAFWQQEQIFEKSVAARSENNAYVFYDGPPFATGLPHYGHLLASTTKDVIPRYQTMRGKRVNRVWGWDCHGLPIENMIEKKLNIVHGKKDIEALGIDQFNQACRSEVMRLDGEWEKIIHRLGRWVDFAHNYKTMDKSYLESVWWGFKQLFQKGLVYEGKKVILYCPRCGTPLSNFEIAMDNSYQTLTEPSTTYKYRVVGEDNTYLLAWSTTPWNKLATPALAVNPQLEYVKVKQNQEFYLLAAKRLAMLTADFYEIVATYTGEELTKFKFELHFDFYPDRQPDERAGVVVADEFVTADEGTGVVTLAAYGEDDFRVMQKHQIQLVIHVDDEGKLKPEVKPWAGMDILAVNPLVDEELASRGLIYAHQPHEHSVPVCYRCGTRLYYAPVPAWFINVAKIKDQLIAENEKINWFPAHLKKGRFLKGLINAPDWNISRSRYWGTPMPIWRGQTKDGRVLTRVIASQAELAEWAVDPAQVNQLTDLHREFVDPIEVYVDDDRQVIGHRIPEVFDCWVESGSMPFASVGYPLANKDFFDHNYPAQFVSEYIAQTRAWFYTMHVLSVAIFGRPPFENVLTTGTILAEDGSKMSKSKHNYPDPMKLIDQYGADSLRLYLMSSPVMKGENLNFDEKEVADLRRRVVVIWWNMISFYKLFVDQPIVEQLPDLKSLSLLDRWLVSRINSLSQEMTTSLDGYDVVKASRLIIDFVNQFSTWYLRLSRDRLRTPGISTQIFGWALVKLAQLAAPIMPYFTEIVYQNLVDETGSIHLTDWPLADDQLIDHQLEAAVTEMMAVIELGRAQRQDHQVKMRQPLAKVSITVAPDSALTNDPILAQELITILKEELNVKEVAVTAGSEVTTDFDWQLTSALIEEATARELIRQIQSWRRAQGLAVTEVVKITLPDWPVTWQSLIEQKTHTQLTKGDQLAQASN